MLQSYTHERIVFDVRKKMFKNPQKKMLDDKQEFDGRVRVRKFLLIVVFIMSDIKMSSKPINQCVDCKSNDILKKMMIYQKKNTIDMCFYSPEEYIVKRIARFLVDSFLRTVEIITF